MKKILVLTLLLVVLPYTFFPSNPDWFKLDQSIGRCYSAGAATTYFGLVLWGPCRDLDDYLFFIRRSTAGAEAIHQLPWWKFEQTSKDFQDGFVVGMFMTAEISCPQGVTAAVIQSSMEGRIYNGLSQRSDLLLAVFAQAAASLGCRYNK